MGSKKNPRHSQRLLVQKQPGLRVFAHNILEQHASIDTKVFESEKTKVLLLKIYKKQKYQEDLWSKA